jgi:MFS family permease
LPQPAAEATGAAPRCCAPPAAVRLLLGTLTGRIPGVALPVLVLLATVHSDGGFATAGTLAALQSLAASLGQPLLARHCDRFGHRRTVAGSTAATTLVLLALAATPARASATAALRRSPQHSTAP